MLALLLAYLLAAPALSTAQDLVSVKLAWTPNAEPDLAGYRLYYGPTSGNYTSSIDIPNESVIMVDGEVTSVVDVPLGERTYFAVTAYDYSENRSAYSDEVFYRPEVISEPALPAGPREGLAGVVYGFSTGAASSSSNDPLQYRFHWGDGTASDWIAPVATGTVRAWKAWSTEGTHEVVAEARCVLHPSATATSTPATVSVVGGDSLLIADSFSDGTADGDPQWQTLSGIWKVDQDKKFVSGSLEADSMAVVEALSEFLAGRISTKIKLARTSLRRSAGVIFSLTDAGHYRYVAIRGSRIYLGQVGDTPGEMAGVKVSKARTFLTDTWYHVRVDIHPDGRVRVFLGRARRPILTYRFADAIAGGIGTVARKSVAHYDDFRAWDERRLP